MTDVEFAFRGTETAAEWAEWELTNARTIDGELVLATRAGSERLREGLDAVDGDGDSCGQLFLLGADGTLSEYDPVQETLDRIGRAPDDDGLFEREQPVAIAVTDDRVFLAGEDGDGGHVLALSRFPLRSRWVSDAAFDGVVALAAADTDVYVLQAATGTGSGRVTRLGRNGTATLVVDGLSSPIDIAVDGAGTGYVLDRRDGDLVVGRFSGDAGDVSFADSDAEVFPEGTTHIQAGGPGVVVAAVCPEGETRTTLYRYRFAEPLFERLGRFEGRCTALVPAPGRGFYALAEDADSDKLAREGTVLSLLETAAENRPVPHRTGVTSEFAGRAVARFDAGERGTEWHRLTLDHALGPGGTRTQVQVRYYATDADDPTPGFDALDGVDESAGTRLRAAGVEDLAGLAGLDPAEVAETVGVSTATSSEWIARAWAVLDERWEGREWSERPTVNPRDALLEGAVGRYLWVRLDLAGTVDASPRVRSLRAYFPRQSLLRYLPAIYREDEASAAFLTRFLSLFESPFVDVEEEIEGLTRNFDPYGIDEAYLPWLGDWLAVDVDETWPEPAKREFLARAPELFKQRGTRAGLLETVDIYLAGEQETAPGTSDPDEPDGDDGDGADDSTDQTADADGAADQATGGAGERSRIDSFPYIWEDSDLDVIATDSGAKADYRRLLGHPRGFVLLLDPSVTDEQLGAVERIVEESTPAHAAGRAVRLRPWTRLGSNAYLGVNSYLPVRELVLERSSLGEDSALVGREADR